MIEQPAKQPWEEGYQTPTNPPAPENPNPLDLGDLSSPAIPATEDPYSAITGADRSGQPAATNPYGAGPEMSSNPHGTPDPTAEAFGLGVQQGSSQTPDGTPPTDPYPQPGYGVAGVNPYEQSAGYATPPTDPYPQPGYGVPGVNPYEQSAGYGTPNGFDPYATGTADPNAQAWQTYPQDSAAPQGYDPFGQSAANPFGVVPVSHNVPESQLPEHPKANLVFGFGIAGLFIVPFAFVALAFATQVRNEIAQQQPQRYRRSGKLQMGYVLAIIAMVLWVLGLAFGRM